MNRSSSSLRNYWRKLCKIVLNSRTEAWHSINAQIAFYAYNTQFNVTVYPRGERPRKEKTGTRSVGNIGVIFTELLKADLRTGPLSAALARKAGNSA